MNQDIVKLKPEQARFLADYTNYYDRMHGYED